MNFLQPQFFYGLIALSIPIIVHLFHFRKAKKVYFPNTVFIEQVKQSSSAKRKIKHYLILLSRLLAILFLVLAFAQPFIPASQVGLQKSYVVIFLDNSHSMSNLTPAEIRGIDEAISYTNQLIELYPPDTKFLLLTNDFDHFSNQFQAFDKISDRLTELSLSSRSRSALEIRDRIASITLANNVGDYDLYWIGDFQKSTLPSIDDLLLDTTTSLQLLPVTYTDIANLSIDSVFQDNPFAIEPNKAKVTAIVNNSGTKDIEEAALKLYINDRQVSSKTVSLDGNSKVKVEFDVVYDLSKKSRAYFTIDDYPIAFDNHFYFMLEEHKSLNIIEIIGKNVRVKSIENVYGNPRLFDLQSMSEGNIDYDAFTVADMIVLHGLSSLPSSLLSHLQSYQQSGGRLVIIPSDTLDPSVYQPLVYTKVTFTDFSQDAPMIALQNPDLNDRFFTEIFEDKNAKFDMPSVKILLDWSRLHPLLSTISGNPYLSYSTQVGSTFIFASPLSSEYTDLAQQALFVPVMYKIASHASNKIGHLYHPLKDPSISIPVDSISHDHLYKLTQNGKELIPNQMIKGKSIVLELPRGELTAGYAQLHHNNKPIAQIALNHNNIESDPEQWHIEALENLADANKNIRLFSDIDVDNFTQQMKSTYHGTPLWRYALGLCLLFLFLEILIIKYFGQ